MTGWEGRASLPRSLAAYVIILIGTLLYCYNFNIVDYVRPYLVDRYRFSVSQTSGLVIVQDLGVTAGALVWASLVLRLGYRVTFAAIVGAMGLFALMLANLTGLGAWMAGRALLSTTLGGFNVITTTAVVALFPIAWRARLGALSAATYPLSNILLGTLGGWFGDDGWQWLLWIGALPLLLAPLALVIPPIDIAGREHPDGKVRHSRGWREMLSPRWRWRTIGCVILSGLDFNAYQFFAAFVTLYLKNNHGANAVEIGQAVSLLSVGSLVGAFFWAWIADRVGRRWAALGYVVAALSILLVLFSGLDGWGLTLLITMFGFGIACNSAWGVWFAELFPQELRSYGAALFHVGHIIALAAPVITALFISEWGLITTMALAAPTYLIGTIIWFALPETLGRPPIRAEP